MSSPCSSESSAAGGGRRGRFGMALAALVLLLFALGPDLDRLVCGDEAGWAVAAAEPAGDIPHPPGEAEACRHGHCHHPSPVAPAAPAGADAPERRMASLHRLARDRIATSDPQFALRRPPRA